MTEQLRARRGKLLFSALFYALAAAFFAFFLAPICGAGQDYVWHTDLCREYFAGEIQIPHPGLYLLLRAVERVFRCGPHAAMTGLMAAFTLLHIAATERALRIFGPRSLSYPLRLTAALCLSFVTALYVPAVGPFLTLGSGSPTVWHNPTFILVRPFVPILAVALAALQRWAKSGGGSRVRLGRLAVPLPLFFLSTLALAAVSAVLKPSLLFFLIPAAGLQWLFHLASTPRRPWLVVSALLVSMGLFLVGQYLLSWDEGQSTIAVALFEVLGLYTDHIALATLLGVAFPLSLLLLCWRAVDLRRNLLGQIALLSWAVAFLEQSLLCETGWRMHHGNFLWSYYLALSLLFLFAAAELLKILCDRRGRVAPWRVIPPTALFFTHLYFGFFYAVQLMRNPNFL